MPFGRKSALINEAVGEFLGVQVPTDAEKLILTRATTAPTAGPGWTVPEMAKKKTNPRRRPASMADVERAKDKARTETVRTSWSIFFTVLLDKEGMAKEDLCRIFAEVEYLSDSVIRGYCSVADLRDTLRREAGIVIE